MRTVYILFVAVVLHAVVAVPNCGKFHAPSGLLYDLSPLTRPPTDPWYYNTTKGEQYYWNFCANLVDVPIPVELLSEEATAILISDTVYPIGQLQGYELSELAPGAIQLSYSVSGKLSAGKSTCPNGISRISSIAVWCDKTTEGAVQSIAETSACSYTITMISRHVCVGPSPTVGIATESPKSDNSIELSNFDATEQPTRQPTTITIQPTDEITNKPTSNNQPHINSFTATPKPSPDPQSPSPPTVFNSPSSSSSGSRTITIVLVVLLVVVAFTTYRRLRRRALHAHYLGLQQQERQQQHGSVPLSDIQSHNYYPQQQQPLFYLPQQEQQQPHLPFIPPLHQPFYMVAPQLTQQQQRQHLRQYQQQ